MLVSGAHSGASPRTHAHAHACAHTRMHAHTNFDWVYIAGHKAFQKFRYSIDSLPMQYGSAVGH